MTDQLVLWIDRSSQQLVRTDPPGFEACYPLTKGDNGDVLMSAPQTIQRLRDLQVISVIAKFIGEDDA